MLYASDIARHSERFNALLEKDNSDLPDLVGRLLAQEVDRRLRRNLSRGYVARQAVLSRVRGKIDVLRTTTRMLVDRGDIACRFEDLTLDTVRNRLIRAALDRIAHISSRDIAGRCRRLRTDLERAGVGRMVPSQAEATTVRVSGHDAGDQFMVSLAKLALDLALPTEEVGSTPFVAASRDEHWIRMLFERAVGGFYTVELAPLGWTVRPGEILRWPAEAQSSGVERILPIMKTDISLLGPDGHRIVIDTKFTSIVQKGVYQQERLKSAHLYQLYSYLRSQESLTGERSLHSTSSGVLLHPAIEQELDEHVTIQGHKIRFITVDLAGTPESIRHRLRGIPLQDHC